MKNRITVLFAATKSLNEEFTVAIIKKITKLWNGVNSAVSILSEDSSTPHRLLTCSNSLQDSASASPTCMNMKMGDSVIFTVNLSVIKCQQKINSQRTFIFLIYQPLKLVLDYHIKCGCDCNNIIDNKTNKYCNNKGVIICGECNCEDNWYNIAVFLKIQQYAPVEELAYAGNVNVLIMKGYCDCDKCKCHPKYMGDNCGLKNCSHSFWNTLCQKDNKNCNDRGKCECGKCFCNNEYEGKFCEEKIVKEFQKENDCPKQRNFYIIGFGISGGIVAIGLIIAGTLYSLNLIYERRNWIFFLNEKQRSSWIKDENPLYKSKQSIYSNSAYQQINF
ncbi:hypothetical protein MXB_299 [Myxobolus squamalis]|nr:hypothetical protein MXB_299 [Myxobolus squamalis]